MLFAALYAQREGSPVGLETFLARRMQGAQVGKPPKEGRIEGLEVVGEYWLQTSHPKVIVIFKAESAAPILDLSTDWEEYFDITVVPAIRVEDLM